MGNHMRSENFNDFNRDPRDSDYGFDDRMQNNVGMRNNDFDDMRLHARMMEDEMDEMKAFNDRMNQGRMQMSNNMGGMMSNNMGNFGMNNPQNMINSSRGMIGGMGGGMKMMGGGSNNFMGGMSQNMSMNMGSMGTMSQKISRNMGSGTNMIGGGMRGTMGNEPMGNMGNRMSRDSFNAMRSNDIQGSNFGGMGQRMQGGMNNPGFGGDSVNRGAPMMRSGMDRDFRGESRRLENSSFVIGGGDDDDVEEIMEDEQKFTGGFSKFGNMSRGGSIMSNM